MEKTYVSEKEFNQEDFTETALPKVEYEDCHFINCNFSNSDLANIIFAECKFTACNLSMALLTKASFRDVKFKDCKLLGLHFEHCNEFIFNVDFDNCVLNLSSFYKMKLKKTSFKNSTLHEIDFTDADLSSAVFNNCDLAGTIFYNTILEKADLTTACNYSINPEINKIKKAKFSTAGIAGLLDKYDIIID